MTVLKKDSDSVTYQAFQIVKTEYEASYNERFIVEITIYGVNQFF